MARKLAKKNNIDITRISGSGPNGRIVVADIESAVKHGIQNIASAPGQTLSGEALQEVIIPVSMQRKVIAERLAESKYSSPHFYLNITTAVDKIIAARCILPVSERDDVPANFGLRHRAAVGMSEATESLILIVSEETGQISIAQNGILFENLSIKALRQSVKEYFSDTDPILKAENVVVEEEA